MNKLTLYLSFVMALFMFSACASQPKSTVKADSTVIYADEDSGYKATVVMEFFKKTNKSITHNSELAVVVGGKISNALKDINVNIDYPSVVTSEFTSRGDIDMIKEGALVAKREKKNLVFFMDVQIHKRMETLDGDRIINTSINSWLVDASKKKLVFRILKKGSKVVGSDASLAEVDDAVREAVIYAANALGEETSRLLKDYLSAA